MAKKQETSSPKMATLASKTLRNPNAGVVAKKLAGSVLTNAADKKKR